MSACPSAPAFFVFHARERRLDANPGTRPSLPDASRDMSAADGPARAAASAVLAFALYVSAGCAFGVSTAACLVGLIALDDLQSDFINPHDCARRVNRAVRVEVVAHVVGAVLTLMSGHWIAFAVNAPLMWWHWERCGGDARTTRTRAREAKGRWTDDVRCARA